MTEYIDRNALLKKIRWASDAEEAVISVRRMPAADVVKVVRCRDCKYHEDTHVTGFEHCCLYGLTMRHNDFCSYGKRKGGADND